MGKIFGIILVLLGLAAVIWPVLAGVASVLYLGIALVVAGVAELFQAYRIKGAAYKTLWSIFGIITILCGTSLWVHPLIGISFIVMILAGYFIIDGVFRIFAAFIKSERRIWYIFNGIISLLLGYLVFSMLLTKPFAADWILGTFFGINLIFKGFMIIAINSKYRN